MINNKKDISGLNNKSIFMDFMATQLLLILLFNKIGLK